MPVASIGVERRYRSRPNLRRRVPSWIATASASTAEASSIGWSISMGRSTSTPSAGIQQRRRRRRQHRVHFLFGRDTLRLVVHQLDRLLRRPDRAGRPRCSRPAAQRRSTRAARRVLECARIARHSTRQGVDRLRFRGAGDLSDWLESQRAPRRSLGGDASARSTGATTSGVAGGVRLAAHLDPHILSASCGDDGESIEDAVGRKDLVLDRAELVERALLIGRQDLGEHARHRVERQHARRQLHLSPGERTAIRVHGCGRVITYGFSPTCITSASPSRRTMASSSESSSFTAIRVRCSIGSGPAADAIGQCAC